MTRRRFGLGLAATLTGGRRAAGASRGAPTVRVAIRDFAFDPAEIVVPPGGSVEWRNEDIAPHTATGQAGAWDTGALSGGETARVVFGREGTHDYFCAFHPHMRGRVVVRRRSR